MIASPLRVRSCVAGGLVAAALSLSCLGSMPDRPLGKTPCPMGETCPVEREGGSSFEQTIHNDVDVVFMLDNTEQPQQNSVTRSFPTFMNVLRALPAGLPDLHIGIVSSSLGAGAFSDVPGCPAGGDRGAFQNLPRGNNGACTAVPRDHYIVSLDKGTRNNFTGDIADVFMCIGSLGSSGCGFEHQLASTVWALGGSIGGHAGGAPAENAGFLRDDALLAVIWVTNEDDCSAPVDSTLFDTKQSSITDPLGPLASFRCNEFGHLCGGARPPRATAKNLQGCHSAEDAGMLIKVADFVSFFKTVKKAPNHVILSAIAAPPEPYSVGLNGAGEPGIVHSCAGSNGGVGDPGVRMKELIDAFGTNGTFNSICADSFTPALEGIARQIGKRLGTQCLDGVLKDTSPDDGVQPECTVVDQTNTAMGSVSTPLPACDKGAPPCWRLASNPRDCAASGVELKIDRGGAPTPPGTTTTIRCQTCAPSSSPVLGCGNP